MVICVKCGKEQGRRSWAQCEYDGNEKAGKEHAWEDRGEFIDELRSKLPPFIRERIAALQKKLTEKRAVFIESLALYNKRLDVLKAAYAVYLNEGLPRDVEKKQQRAFRSLLFDTIPMVIGVLLAFKWIVPLFDIEGHEIFGLELTSLIILASIALAIFSIGKSAVKYFEAVLYAKSQVVADDLAYKWRYNNGYDELESDIEAEKDTWNNTHGSYERVIYDAERALVGSDEELLNFYNKDNRTKNQYLEKVYWGEW